MSGFQLYVINGQAITFNGTKQLLFAPPNPLDQKQHFRLDDKGYIISKTDPKLVFDLHLNDLTALKVGLWDRKEGSGHDTLLNQQWALDDKTGGIQSRYNNQYFAKDDVGVCLRPVGLPVTRVDSAPYSNLTFVNNTDVAATISWAYDGKEEPVGTVNIKQTWPYSASTGAVLTIRGPGGSFLTPGRFTVTASATINISKATAPQLSYDVTANDEIKLNWAIAIPESNIRNFYVAQDLPAGIPDSAIPAGTYSDVKKLTPGATYKFRLYYVDTAGNRGPDSNVVTVSLPGLTPVTLVHENAGTNVVLAWSKSFSPSGAAVVIKNYIVHRVLPTPDEIVVTNNTLAFTATLGNQFRFYVTAVTVDGLESPRSNVDTFVIGNSRPITRVLSYKWTREDRVQLSWSKAFYPALDDSVEPDTTYTLTQTIKGSTRELKGIKTPYDLNVPQPGDYQFSLIGENAVGKSKVSNTVKLIVEDPFSATPPAVPKVTYTAPTVKALADDGSRTIHLEWNPPFKRNTFRAANIGTPASGIKEFHIAEVGSTAPPTVVPVSSETLPVKVSKKVASFSVASVSTDGLKSRAAILTLGDNSPPSPILTYDPPVGGKVTIKIAIPDGYTSGKIKKYDVSMVYGDTKTVVPPQNSVTFDLPGPGTYKFYAYATADTEEGELDSGRSNILDVKFNPQYLDLVFLVDCTGSMGSSIEQVKTKIVQIVDTARSLYPSITPNLSFVGYRDYMDAVPVDVFPFNTDVDAFKQKIATVRADGGGQTPEDIVVGFAKVTALDWTATSRSLIHIADAPCHGTKYNGGIADDSPSGSPSGLNPEALVVKIVKDLRVQYNFLRINSTTDIMINIFQNAIAPDVITTFSLSSDASDFVTKIVSLATAALL